MSEPPTTPLPPNPQNNSANTPAPLLSYASGSHFPISFPQSADTPDEVFRDGPTLICTNGITLPPRCVLCGDEGAGPPIRLTLAWDSSFHITRQSTLEMGKQASVYAFLCPRHRRKWSRARSIGGIGLTVSVLAMFAGMALAVYSENSPIPFYTSQGLAITIVSFALVIIFLFFFTLRSYTLSCSRIQEGYLYLEGADDAFLDTLPQVRQNPPNKNP
jgi:hypothetical protein